MKKEMLLFIILLMGSFAHAQVGINASYLQYASSNNWTNGKTSSVVQNNIIELPGAGFSVGIDYRMKLRNIRIEFYPGISYSNQQQDIVLGSESLNAETTAFHLLFSSRIYPLDLEGDCDCPTWRKKGPTLEKGLFFQLSTGLSFFDFGLDNQNNIATTSDDTAFHLGAGIGFDLGINDLLTITPIVLLRYYPSVSWAGLANENSFDFPDEIQAESNLLQYHLGLRLGFHLRQ